MTKKTVKEILKEELINTPHLIKGWVRTIRQNKHIAFIEVNDGSCVKGLQVIADKDKIPKEILLNIQTGVSIKVEGILVESLGKGQNVEIQAETIKIYGNVDKSYPLQKKQHSYEFLRKIAHLRPRTNTFGAIFRLRHSVSFAIHQFFNTKGFFYFHTPIITSSDCEGAGSMFRATTLDLANIPKTKSGLIDFESDFFGKETHLTVSGQLEGELGAMGLGKIYTFGPTFRAEKSFTSRHLSEFWMIEPEAAFFDITDNMNLAEDFLKYVINYILENDMEDLEYLNSINSSEDKENGQLIEKLKFVVDNTFERVSYTEGINILKKSKKHLTNQFEYNKIVWGMDLQSEHERYLVEEVFEKPVILTDYPKDIKAFYMKINKDKKTVRAMDVLFPKIGEIIGGSEREENYTKLMERISELMLNVNDLSWYLDTRKYGTVPHSGFGLGFERLMLFVTGMKNIRDVIPFPRTPGNAKF